jgi:hypothetical protein
MQIFFLFRRVVEKLDKIWQFGLDYLAAHMIILILFSLNMAEFSAHVTTNNL